jgi:hypothetical protein
MGRALTDSAPPAVHRIARARLAARRDPCRREVRSSAANCPSCGCDPCAFWRAPV